jgi:hypothetical protein
MLNFANIPQFSGTFREILEKSFPPNFLHKTVLVNLKMDFSELSRHEKAQNHHFGDLMIQTRTRNRKFANP